MAGLGINCLGGGLKNERKKVNSPRGQSCGDDIAGCTALFFEADRLDDLAYRILDSDADPVDMWRRFTEAKNLADQQRVAAAQNWERTKKQGKN